eukprot:c9010_g1_i1 orf=299-1810(+)
METSAMGPQNGLSPSCTAGSSQRESHGNVLTTHMDSRSAVVEGSKTFCEIGAGYGGPDNLSRKPSSVERFMESKTGPEQSFVEAKGDHVQGSNSSLVTKQISPQSQQKADTKQLGKRAAAQLEKEISQQKKPRPTSNKVSTVKKEKDGSKPPAIKVLKKLVSSPTKLEKESLEEKGIETLAKQGIDVVSVRKSSDPTALFRVQPKSRGADITKEEAAIEYEQCKSLLQKYGVLHTPEYYLSQIFPNSAPHPGSVGDKLQSKRCKICRALEDPNNTVICDECQEAFHLSCCLPRLNLKHFDREDDWYCGSCRKQKRRMGSFNSYRFFDRGCVNSSGKVYSAGMSYISKVRLGPAHQADVPLWTGKDNTTAGCFGMEEPLSQEAKDGEKERILKDFELRVETLRKQNENMFSNGTSENWLKCHNVVVQAFTDHAGHKHSQIICGKWRRAPLNIQQSDHWECFCVMEWDPLHADCAIPQEFPTEEILQRMQVKSDLPSEVLKSEET